jgi:hypothetical protein
VRRLLSSAVTSFSSLVGGLAASSAVAVSTFWTVSWQLQAPSPVSIFRELAAISAPSPLKLSLAVKILPVYTISSGIHQDSAEIFVSDWEYTTFCHFL